MQSRHRTTGAEVGAIDLNRPHRENDRLMKVKPLRVGKVIIGGRDPVFILGPCVIESEKFVRRMAKKIAEICAAEDVDFIFKASYDKANRTSVSSFRGIGVREGCEILSTIGRDLKVPVTTDVHSPAEAEIAGENIDMLQIPAFLCRQTDLLRAAAETRRAVNVKKGQFLAPWDVRNIAEKLIAFGNEKFCFTERGTSFGYNNLIADMRSLYWLRDAGYRVIFDATHSVQRPGGAGDSTSGDGILAPALARAAMATGCDGIFMEVHENPARALSDGPNQIPLKDLPKNLRVLKAIHAAVSGRRDQPQSPG
jgi:2-dehydro-3-deoxyphosphooctonate aldolase (KDO 8-P synthase)